MKKVFILLIAVAGMVSAMAQEKCCSNDTTPSPYKFQKGSVATELNFTPFFNNTPTVPELKLRIGVCKSFVFRVNLGLNFDHKKFKTILDNAYERCGETITIKGERTEKNKYTQFSIAPGIEYHFGNWKRLSLYAGCEIPVGVYTTRSAADEISDVTHSHGSVLLYRAQSTFSLETKNCNSIYGNNNYYYRQTGKVFFGIKAFTGFDFYIYKGLYFGAELGLGYTCSFALKGTAKGSTTMMETYYRNGEEYLSVPSMEVIDRKFEDKITEGIFNFKCNPMIRLGWRF